MTKHRRILNIIANIRDSHPDMVSTYTQGGCMWFFTILRSIFPEAVAFYNSDHIITKIDKHYYDITGTVIPKGYLPFSEFCPKKRSSRAFVQMTK